MSKLSERMLASREFSREVKGWKLKLRRPLHGELVSAYRMHADAVEAERSIAHKHTVGWKDVKEADLIKSGSDIFVDFDPDAWLQILLADTGLWQEIRLALDDEYKRYEESQEAKLKN